MVTSCEIIYCIVQFLAYFHSANLAKKKALEYRIKSNLFAWSLVYVAVPLAIILLLGWYVSNGWLFVSALGVQIPLILLSIIVAQIV